jgi:ABC-type transport system substrate-binding protein
VERKRPVLQGHQPNHSYFNDMGMPKLLKSVDKVNDYTVKITLNTPLRRRSCRTGDAVCRCAVQGICDAMLKAGTPEKIDQEPIGTGPFMLVQYQKDAMIRYKAFPSTGPARPRSTTWSSRSRPMHRCAGPSCKRANAMSCPTRTRPTCRHPQGCQRHGAGAGPA